MGVGDVAHGGQTYTVRLDGKTVGRNMRTWDVVEKFGVGSEAEAAVLRSLTVGAHAALGEYVVERDA